MHRANVLRVRRSFTLDAAGSAPATSESDFNTLDNVVGYQVIRLEGLVRALRANYLIAGRVRRVIVLHKSAKMKISSLNTLLILSTWNTTLAFLPKI